MASSPVVIDDKVRFSQAQIWRAQRDYYNKRGIAAWTGDVPFYITSNAYIGSTYATLVIRFIQDWLHREPNALSHVFYVIELGTGSGQFSYYFLRQFERLRAQLKLESIKFCYVMSDFTQTNIDFWLEHKGLAKFVEQGMLDFAVFDVEHDSQVQLIKSQAVLSAQSLVNPLIVFANYLFDSVVSDVFNVENGQLHESLVTMQTTQHNMRDGQPISWPGVRVSYTDAPVTQGYYKDVHFENVLKSYERDLENGAFLFPIGSLRVIRQLLTLSNHKLLLLSSDKGHIDIEELKEESHPELDFHGSFSVMVNYDAIGRYFTELGGDHYMQCPRDAIVTAAFLVGSPLNELTEFQFALDQHVSEFSPADYFNIYENIERNPKAYNIDTLASALSLSHWDPGLFNDISSRISDCIDNADHDLIEYLKKYLHRVAQNYYHMPDKQDTIFEVGIFFQEIGEYESALHFLKLSREYFPACFEFEFNCGLCYNELQQYDQALAHLEAALQYDPKSIETKKLIKQVQGSIGK